MKKSLLPLLLMFGSLATFAADEHVCQTGISTASDEDVQMLQKICTDPYQVICKDKNTTLSL